MAKNTVFVVHADDAGESVGFPKIAGTAAAVAAAVAEYVEHLMVLAECRSDVSDESRTMFRIEVREVDVREE